MPKAGGQSINARMFLLVGMNLPPVSVEHFLVYSQYVKCHKQQLAMLHSFVLVYIQPRFSRYTATRSNFDLNQVPGFVSKSSVVPRMQLEVVIGRRAVAETLERYSPWVSRRAFRSRRRSVRHDFQLCLLVIFSNGFIT